jgi:hypothetical protein
MRRAGTGRRNEPFRYWLPGREEQFSDLELSPIPDLGPLRIPDYRRRKKGG